MLKEKMLTNAVPKGIHTHTKIFIVYLKIKLNQSLSCISFQELLLFSVMWTSVCLFVSVWVVQAPMYWIPWIWGFRRSPDFWCECWELNSGTLREQYQLFPDVLCFYLVPLLQFYSGTVSTSQGTFQRPSPLLSCFTLLKLCCPLADRFYFLFFIKVYATWVQIVLCYLLSISHIT